MALWHWLLGGAAAYMMLGRKAAAAPATTGAATTEAQMQASEDERNVLRTTFANAVGAAAGDVNLTWNGTAWEFRLVNLGAGLQLTAKNLADLQAQIAANPNLRGW